MKHFSIRELLLVVVIVSLALGWLSDRCDLEANHRKQEHELVVKLQHDAVLLDASYEKLHQLQIASGK